MVVPARPGITNALGCMVADLRHDFVRTVNTPLAALDVRTVHETLAEQIRQGREMLGRERVQFDAVRVIHSADMQFQGQSHILSVPLESATPGIDELQRLFEAAYWHRFEVELPEIRAVLVNLHTAVLGRRPGHRPRIPRRRAWRRGRGGRQPPRSCAPSGSRPGAAKPAYSGANRSAREARWKDRRSSSSSTRRPCCHQDCAAP